jgi:fumarate reductase flavoprotein subunit
VRYPRRSVLKAAAALAGSATLALPGRALAASRERRWDLIVVGGGNAGLPAAIFAAQRGARVLIIDTAAQLGGTLHLSTGQMSAAGTKLQISKGITDSPQSHYDDVMRISGNTADPQLLRLAVDQAAPAFDWLTDHGFKALPEHPITGTTHDPYSHARYAWGKEGGRSILKVLLEQLQPHLDTGRVQTLLQTEVTRLLQARDGSVRGVETRNLDEEKTQHLARYTVLTCGGYTDNRALFEKYEGHRSYSQSTYPFSQGAGYTLGEAAGGYIRGGENHTPLFGAVLANDDYPSPMRAMVRHFPPDRPPWEIFVNRAGQRFVREDVPSHTSYEHALGAQPDERCWVVFDDAILNAAPPLAAGFGVRYSQQDLRKLFDGGTPHFYRADSIAELAQKAGVDASGLSATIADYNRAQASGQDALGRQYLPLPIAKAPYYAIRLQSWNLTSYAGLAVDRQLRVIRRDGTAIRNLYAAGELLGMGQLMGHAVCGGMSVTPALAFGRLLGREILQL